MNADEHRLPVNEIIHGDCLEVMRGWPDNCVDAVVTDPPYGQSNETYDKGVPLEVWQECFRLARPSAAILSFAGSPTYHRIAGDIERAGWRVRQMWAWVYRDGMITSAYPKEGFDRLTPAFDPICFATKGKVLLRVARIGDARWARSTPGSRYSGRSGRVRSLQAKGHYPQTVVSDGCAPFEYFILSRTSPRLRSERTPHPNQKPRVLLEWLLGKLPAGGIVLDPFCGSGTTCVAAMQEGRDYIGIDILHDYCEIARRRVAATEKNLFASSVREGEEKQ